MKKFKHQEQSFACSECGAVATKILLLSAGTPHPRADSTSRGDLGIVGPATPEAHAIVVESVICKSRSRIDDISFKSVREILYEKEDADTLYRIDPEYVPSYCPQCQKHYCRKHWLTNTTFNEGFYDATYGVCPHGHTRKLDD
jgi:hypothetical protein